MEKLVYLVEQGAATDPERAAGQLFDAARALAGRADLAALALNLRDDTPAVRELARDYATSDGPRQLIGSLSAWIACLDERAPLEHALAATGLPFHGYLVTESVPIDYAARDWPLGTRSPGVTLVAAFRKPERLDDEEFFRRWHVEHSRLSREVHPLWRYLRNSVARALTPGAPPFRGIVEERVRSVADLEPANFYRGRQAEVSEDLGRFVDFGLPDAMRIELMGEYLLR